MASTVLRLPAVQAMCGLSRSTIYARIQEGTFPSTISLGARAVGWVESEIAALNAARISGMSNNQIRELVTKLVSDRKLAK